MFATDEGTGNSRSALGGIDLKHWYGRNEGPGSSSQYDPKKVEQLHKTLLETLKHATNIRSLKPEDSVVVVVQGGYRTMPALADFTGTAPGRAAYFTDLAEPLWRYSASDTSRSGWFVTPQAGLYYVDPSSGKLSVFDTSARTTLTVRVKKSDIDAFARGELSFEAWREKAATVTYWRRRISPSCRQSARLPSPRERPASGESIPQSFHRTGAQFAAAQVTFCTPAPVCARGTFHGGDRRASRRSIFEASRGTGWPCPRRLL